MKSLSEWIKRPIQYLKEVKSIQVNLDMVNEGFHQSEDFFFTEKGANVKYISGIATTMVDDYL